MTRVTDNERRAYVCTHKEHVVYTYRVFLMPGDEEPPRCPEHGKTMKRQANFPYRRKEKE